MTNDEVRQRVTQAGITTDNVTMIQLEKLHKELCKKLQESKCFRSTFRMNPNVSKFMTCKSDYFENREAVSFNPDGFIGMAGWADSKNIKPVQDAVIAWADNIAKNETRK